MMMTESLFISFTTGTHDYKYVVKNISPTFFFFFFFFFFFSFIIIILHTHRIRYI